MKQLLRCYTACKTERVEKDGRPVVSSLFTCWKKDEWRPFQLEKRRSFFAQCSSWGQVFLQNSPSQLKTVTAWFAKYRQGVLFIKQDREPFISTPRLDPAMPNTLTYTTLQTFRTSSLSLIHPPSHPQFLKWGCLAKVCHIQQSSVPWWSRD